jgi:nucleotide-binding universal stress UspA family protein
MKTARLGPVVVGVDQSEASTAAVAYAAWQARRRGLGSRLVHGFVSRSPLSRRWPSPKSLLEWRRPIRGMELTTRVVAGSGGKALVDESQTAGLLVVGSRGEGGFPGVLLGSVAAQVAEPDDRWGATAGGGRAGVGRGPSAVAAAVSAGAGPTLSVHSDEPPPPSWAAAPQAQRRSDAGARARRSWVAGSVSEQSVGQDRGLSTAFDAEFGQQAGDVVLDRLLRQEEFLTDLPVGHALGDQL